MGANPTLLPETLPDPLEDSMGRLFHVLTVFISAGFQELALLERNKAQKRGCYHRRKQNLARVRMDIPFPVENDSFNAQPEAPAFFVPRPAQAGASGWALNEQMCHSSPVEL